MSTKFPSVQAFLNSNGPTELITHFDFSGAGNHYVVLDTDFSDARQFLACARAWLAQTRPEQRLYYFALQPQSLLQEQGNGDCLELELCKKWPPLLPGLHLIDLAQQRIELSLWYGEPVEGLNTLLCHQNGAVHLANRPYLIDQYIVSQMASPEILDAIAVLQGEGVVQARLKNSPWPYGKHKPKSQESKLIIIGGGLAGCYLAYTMAQMGWRVALFDSNQRCGQQGSGNAYSVLYPKLSIYQAPFTELLHQAYPYAFHTWREVLRQHPSLGRCLPLWQEADQGLDDLISFLADQPKWFERANSPEPGILMHNSLIIDMPELCQVLIQHPLIECHSNYIVDDLVWTDEQWQIGQERAPFCVLANGYMASQWPETAFFGVKGMRGQMTHVKSFAAQDAVYCKKGHFLPEWRGVHAIGASYQPDHLNLEPCAQDDEYNLAPWREFFNLPLEVRDQWVGVRGVSLDHIPLVGYVPKMLEFNTQFRRWKHHAHWIMEDQMPNYPGLFAFCGFGSRGLLTIPVLARVIRNFILNEPVFLANHLLQAISPARFLKKELSR